MKDGVKGEIEKTPLPVATRKDKELGIITPVLVKRGREKLNRVKINDF